MNTLRQQQQAFQDHLLRPAAESGIASSIVGAARASAEQRLKVYADAYRLRLVEALGTDFETLHGLLGDEQFHALCLSYIDAHPSRHYSLRYFGQHLSGFLRRVPPYSKQPVLSEMAAFEWALIDAFDAPDNPVLTVEELAGVAPDIWPQLRFELHSCVKRLELSWNVQRIRQALKDGLPPEPPQRHATPESWLIWRQHYVTYFRALAPHEAWALDSVRAGYTFAALCAELCAWVGEEHAASTAAGLLRRWVNDGLVAQVTGAA